MIRRINLALTMTAALAVLVAAGGCGDSSSAPADTGVAAGGDGGGGESVPAEPTVDVPGKPVTGEPVVTRSGLQYYEIVVGEGEQPAGPETKVKVRYTGWLTDGTQFESSRSGGTTFALNGVIKGWTEGVGSMRVGGKRKLVIPGELAYGAAGRNGSIPPNATLVFDIELLALVDYEKVPDTLPGDPVTGDATVARSGLTYYDLLVGEGPAPAGPSSQVSVHYTGWLTDGTQFDSSRGGQPSSFVLSGQHTSENLRQHCRCRHLPI